MMRTRKGLRAVGEALPMKHGGGRFARVRRALVLCVLLAAHTPALAQLQILDLNDLPLQRNMTPMNRLLPIDPHVVIRNYLAKNLPSLWWGREADFGDRRAAVEIHIPEGWQGNPTTAMMRLCPRPNDNLWRTFREIEMRPFFQKKFWPSWTCRA